MRWDNTLAPLQPPLPSRRPLAGRELGDAIGETADCFSHAYPIASPYTYRW